MFGDCQKRTILTIGQLAPIIAWLKADFEKSLDRIAHFP